MKFHPECGACCIHWLFERTAPQTSARKVTGLIRGIVEVLLHNVSPQANIGSLGNKMVFKAFEFTSGLSRHYGDLKQKSNENAKKILPAASEYIKRGKTPESRLNRACFLAAAANVAPLNAPSSPYAFKDILDHGDRGKSVIGDLYGALKDSRHVLYVTDNAGEIGFDSLVIREIKAIGPKVTLVVKKDTFFEDATMDDVYAFGLDKMADKIVTVPGFLAPGYIEPSVARIMKASDFVIAKGTGSYESLHGELVNKKAAYMLKIKCKPIARELGMKDGKIIVKVE